MIKEGKYSTPQAKDKKKIQFEEEKEVGGPQQPKEQQKEMKKVADIRKVVPVKENGKDGVIIATDIQTVPVDNKKSSGCCYIFWKTTKIIPF